MTSVFLKILNMSLSASVVILAVLILRALLRKAPKRYSYILWSVAAFRLCCPVSWKSVFSLFSLRPFQWAASDPIGGGKASSLVSKGAQSAADTTPLPGGVSSGTVNVADQIISSVPAASQTAGAAQSATQSAAQITPAVSSAPDTMQILLTAAIVVWLLGMAALLIYGIASYVKMRHTLRYAVRMEGNIYQSEHVQSPFILGLFRPKIYIPYGLGGSSLRYVLAHEQYHLRRRDHLARSFAFVLLAVHWFNPLCWVAFRLMGKDMEMSCDEKVLSGGEDIAEGYSRSLLSFAVAKRFPAPGPLCFGESGVKSRIKNALNFKKPKVWVTLAAILLCAAAILACTADPPEAGDKNSPARDIEANEGMQEDDIPGLDKIPESISSSPEFKAGGTLRSVRVYFDNSIIGMRIAEKYPDEESLIKYKTEHGLEGYADTKRAIISETIRDEITAILASHGVSADAGTLQFGTTFAHVTISELEYGDLLSLSADERVTKISSFDEGQLLKLDEASLKKTADDYEFDRILTEALPDDEFEVSVLLDLISDDELAKPSQEEIERMAEEYAEKKVGYAYSDIERLVIEASIVDDEHGKVIYDPTEEQNAKIREMMDAYRAARNEYITAHKTYTMTDEEKEIVQKRFDAFLDSNDFDFGEDIHRGTDTLTGKISAADIERLLEFDEVRSISLLEPVIKFSFS